MTSGRPLLVPTSYSRPFVGIPVRARPVTCEPDALCATTRARLRPEVSPTAPLERLSYTRDDDDADDDTAVKWSIGTTFSRRADEKRNKLGLPFVTV